MRRISSASPNHPAVQFLVSASDLGFEGGKLRVLDAHFRAYCGWRPCEHIEPSQGFAITIGLVS